MTKNCLCITTGVTKKKKIKMWMDPDFSDEVVIPTPNSKQKPPDRRGASSFIVKTFIFELFHTTIAAVYAYYACIWNTMIIFVLKTMIKKNT